MTHLNIINRLISDGISIHLSGNDLDVRSNHPLTNDQLVIIKQNKGKLVARLRHKASLDIALLETLAIISSDLSITPEEIRDSLSSEDIENCHKGDININTLSAFARSLVQNREMKQGRVPAHYTKRATCKHCGPVWLWIECEVDGCPWCYNRKEDIPIPRPLSVYCGNCKHFNRINHLNLGHCAKGEPEAIGGLWDTSEIYCEKYIPASSENKKRLNSNNIMENKDR